MTQIHSTYQLMNTLCRSIRFTFKYINSSNEPIYLDKTLIISQFDAFLQKKQLAQS